MKRLQVLSKCGAALLNCAQKKPGDPCAAKAKAKCSKDLGKLSGTTEKFVAAVQKGCANVPQTTMLSAQGLDFAQIADQCIVDFRARSPASKVLPAVSRHSTSVLVEELVTSAMPRVRELAEQVQLTLGAGNRLGDFSKARIPYADPGVDGKPLVACQKAITKAGGRYVSTVLTRLDGCVGKVLSCLQLSRAITAAWRRRRDNARSRSRSCRRSRRSSSTASARVHSTLHRVGSRAGLGLAQLEELCRAVDVDELSSVADYQTCLARQHECLVRDLLQFGTPRAGEVLRLVGDAPPSFCH